MDYGELTDDPHLQKIIAIVTSPYFKKHVVSLEALMFLTRHRYFYADAQQLLTIQDAFAERLIQLRSVNQQGRRNIQALRDANKQNEAREHEYQLARNRYLMRATQMVADGLAFRMLGYDRPMFRMTVAPEKPAGSVDLEKSYPDMRQTAERLIHANGSRVLFNDLTNVLRLGDLTELLPNGQILFHELKQNGKKIFNVFTEMRKVTKDPNAPISKQTARMIKAQIARDQRRIFLDDGYVEIHDLGIPFKNYLDEVARLIRNARQNGTAVEVMDNCLYAYRKSLDYAALHGDAPTLAQSNSPIWDEADIQIETGNYDLCFTDDNDYARNMTPYSVFPLSSRDCLDLITGRLRLAARINISAIARLFREWDWEATTFSGQEIDERLASYTQAFHQSKDKLVSSHTVPALRVQRGAFIMEIPFNLVLRVGQDFMSPTMLVAYAEHARRTSIPGLPVMRDSFILGEQRVWF